MFMKKSLLLFALVVFSTFNLLSQTIVSTDPENKNVVLEEFTGIYCGYCPQGHQIAQAIYDAHPDDVVVIAIHTGGYANPQGNHPDYRTEWGAAIAAQSGLLGYPAATVNRHLFPGWSQGSGTAMSRNHWSAAANQILNAPSYLNVAATATIVKASRLMTVYVEVYYTGSSPNETNLLNIAVMQNNIYGYQNGGSSNYKHMHMLRHLLTGQWGVPITETSEGSFYSGTFSWEVPEAIRDVEVVLEDLDIGVFVSETHQEIISSTHADITYVESFDYDAAIYETHLPKMLCSDVLKPVVTIKNYGNQQLTSLTFNYSINNGETATYQWTGNIAHGSSEDIELPEYTYVPTDNNVVSVSCSSPNGQVDQLPENNTITENIPGSITFPKNCAFGVNNLGDAGNITWNIKDSEGNVIVEGGPYSSSGMHVTDFSFPETGCYTLTLNDASGQGLNGGYYVITDENYNMLWMGTPFTNTVQAQLAYNIIIDVPEYPQATDINIYPNPVSGTATMEFELQNNTHVDAALYDMLGKKISTLYNDNMSSGNNKILIDVTDIEKGVYFAKISFNGNVITKKILVTK